MNSPFSDVVEQHPIQFGNVEDALRVKLGKDAALLQNLPTHAVNTVLQTDRRDCLPYKIQVGHIQDKNGIRMEVWAYLAKELANEPSKIALPRLVFLTSHPLCGIGFELTLSTVTNEAELFDSFHVASSHEYTLSTMLKVGLSIGTLPRASC